MEIPSRLGRYDLIEPLYASDVEVARCVDAATGARVVIKCTRADAADVATPARLRHEYDVLQHLQAARCPGVVEPVEMVEAGGRHLLVLRDAGATSIMRLRPPESPWPTDVALRIAAQVVRSLSQIHRASVLHLDINPRNVVVSEADD
ncbi:MAG TPA: protein kinase, partial [Myxococcota bacterium]|nr:protein kinase [Myxococcota bacterium]